MVTSDRRLVHTSFVPLGYWSPCTPLVWGPVRALDIRFSSSHFRRQHPRHEKAPKCPDYIHIKNKYFSQIPIIIIITWRPIKVQDGQLLSQTLHRTEPYFYHSWISNRPGSIGLGKIDYLIIQDRHDHLYKFDPINNVWLHSINGNGIKFKKYWLNTTDNTTTSTTTTTTTHHHHHNNNKLPHTPTRLLILTTDFEVYSFQLCYNQLKLSTISIITTKELNKLRKNIKNNINLFINLLTKRISYIRKSTGYLLANEYAIHNNNNDTETLIVQQDTTDDNIHKRSNVNTYETNWNDNKHDFVSLLILKCICYNLQFCTPLIFFGFFDPVANYLLTPVSPNGA
ncbi:unnamed protein product [Schistosoma margrebowiei]|uniref:Uncharacterized protein n=1 Tax=Schistosoma margrebowiei TaxID=48269 RepID=A0A183NA42_9TREM|nr:unnamed protein product [Schistosoma margrebowiei]